MYKLKTERYYGSDLNRFIDEKCSHEMTCINIDCLLVKIAKKRIRIIESKHAGEFAPPSQLTALRILEHLLSQNPQKEWKVEFFTVYGDYPFITPTTVENLNEKVRAILSQEQLKQWLSFEKELEELE